MYLSVVVIQYYICSNYNLVTTFFNVLIDLWHVVTLRRLMRKHRKNSSGRYISSTTFATTIRQIITNCTISITQKKTSSMTSSYTQTRYVHPIDLVSWSYKNQPTNWTIKETLQTLRLSLQQKKKVRCVRRRGLSLFSNWNKSVDVHPVVDHGKIQALHGVLTFFCLTSLMRHSQ